APPGTVLKTSSGKIRRAASREIYESGGSTGPRAVWWEGGRLTWSPIVPQATRSIRTAASWVYGAYALLLLGVIGGLTWIACAVLPRPQWCWKLSRRTGRLFFTLTRTPLPVRGLA